MLSSQRFTLRDILWKIARRFYPPLSRLPESERHAAAGYLMRALIFTPFALAGLAWLAAITDRGVLARNLPFVLILFAYILILSQLWLEMYYETTTGGYRSDRRSFWGEALWSGVLVLGPSVAWLGVFLPWINFLMHVAPLNSVQRLRLFSQSIFRMSVLVPTLIEVVVYQALGGVFPLPGLEAEHVIPAIIATLVGFSAGSLMIGISIGVSRIMSPPSANQNAAAAPPRFFLLMTLIGPLAGLVAILPAGLYSLAGMGAYFAFLTLMTGGALLTDRLSRSAENVAQRTRELMRLEKLGEAILAAPPDASSLPDLLQQHVPGMFPLCSVAIRLYPETMLLTHPGGWAGTHPAMWEWNPHAAQVTIYRPNDPRPFENGSVRGGSLIVPILEAKTERVLGRMVLVREHDGAAIERLLPAAQSLASHIGSALHRAHAYRQTIEERVAKERASSELALGARVQASFLPTEIPQFEGWDIAASLEPARETSGDFYDFIPLRGGKLGIVIADVADKGLGAAFYMALCVTLFRSQAADLANRYPRSYARRLNELVGNMNRRLMRDSHTETFVTAFFGILDPKAGTLSYINAGHNPPYLFKRDKRRRVRSLRPTGPALGFFDEFNWKRKTVAMEPGDLLLLYTDGLVEAHNEAEEFFEDERVMHVIRDNLGCPSSVMCDHIFASVYDFVGSAPRFDDITLMLIRRAIDAKIAAVPPITEVRR